MFEFNTHFYGNEISPYGRENGRVDYRTFAKAFDSVLNNSIMNVTREIGYWEQISGFDYVDSNGNGYDEDERDEKVEELEAKLEELEDDLRCAESDKADDEEEWFEKYSNNPISLVDAMLGKDEDRKRLVKHAKWSENLIAERKEMIREIEEDLESLEDYYYPDIFQYYIIDSNGADICKEFGEIVFYNEELDMYVWGVTHYGTSWDYVLTNIPCEREVA